MEEDNIIVATAMHLVQHYNPKKYWKMRSIVIDPNNKTPKLMKLWYLFRIKRMDAYNNASMGTSIGSGAHFATPPFYIMGSMAL